MQARNSSETIWFADSPLPPVRVAKLDRHTGKAVLVFESESAQTQQRDHCEVQVAENCIKGLRASCAVQASRQSRPPWFLSLLGLAKEPNWEEREQREAAATEACVARGAPHCGTHARNFCSTAFSGPVADDIE